MDGVVGQWTWSGKKKIYIYIYGLELSIFILSLYIYIDIDVSGQSLFIFHIWTCSSKGDFGASHLWILGPKSGWVWMDSKD